MGSGFRLPGVSRRAALNEALHELRRPLQALALSVEPGRPAAGGTESSLFLVTAALDRLDEEINGAGPDRVPTPNPVRPMLEAAVGRWRARAHIAGGELRLGGVASAVLEGDPVALSQALDNLIVNAIEHGGPMIEVEAHLNGRRLTITVTDSGTGGLAPRRESPGELFARLTGRGRRGLGLSVVRRVAASHHGSFDLRHSERGAVATLEFPVAPAGHE
jgi:signal transduction histidine kinase